MCDNPKISVIVAIYKAEKYISKCLDSILQQSFPDFELLLIDDGSPDNSGKICDAYAAKDKRVRVFHKENGGVSSARQFGIEHARGEYSIHADPDDWVEPNMLEDLYAKAKSEDADMVICDFYVNYPDQQIYVKQSPSSLDHTVVFTELFQHLHGSCWNKLIKSSCYKDFDISFPVGLNYSEDLYVNALMLLNDLKICYVNKAFYHYEQFLNPSSLVRTRNYDQDLLLMRKFKDKVPEKLCRKWIYPAVVYSLARELYYNNEIPSETYFKYIKPNKWHLIHRKKVSKLEIAIFIIACFVDKQKLLRIIQHIKRTLSKIR